MPARNGVLRIERERIRRERSATPTRSGAPTRVGAVQLSEIQRARILVSAERVLAERGYEQMSVARITHGARVSRRTFYDLFEDREDCFCAVFEDALGRACERVLGAYGAADEGDWRERVRAGLGALLGFFDEEPRQARMLVVFALRAGPRVLARRAQVLAGVSAAIQEQGVHAHRGRESLSPLTGEGVVGGVFAVIHTRLSAGEQGVLSELLGPLMAMIVLPYQGAAAAQREIRRPAPRALPVKADARADGVDAGSRRGGVSVGDERPDPLVGLPMRLTYRTLCVIDAIGTSPGASNREVADLAGITDQGQVSKLLARLERLGLIDNAGLGAQPSGEPNVWRLTARGESVVRQLSLSASSQDVPQEANRAR